MATGIQISPPSDITVGTTAISNGTEGRVLFQGAGNVVQQSNNLFWDNTNSRLGIGTISPATGTSLDVNGRIKANIISVDAVNNTINTVTLMQFTGTGNRLHDNSGTHVVNIRSGNFGIGIGATTPGARLDVRAQGALSTDIAFRVRNSADTVDLLSVNGLGVLNAAADAIFNGVNIGIGGGNISSNTRVGSGALSANTTGTSNVAVGLSSLIVNTTGINNTAIGRNSMVANISGSGNSVVGNQALSNNTTGSNNIAAGIFAGRFIADGTTANSITNNSVFLGAFTKAQADNQTNQIVIGHDSIGAGSNTATLGNTSIVDTVLRGRVNLTQYATGSRPTYVKGALIYDSTLGKLLVGGNSGWEVVTSI